MHALVYSSYKREIENCKRGKLNYCSSCKKKEKILQKIMQNFIRVLQKLKVFTLELGKKNKPKRHFTTNLIKQ